MNKQKLIAAIVEQLKTDLEVLIEAARATYEAATHEESKPENEYDTRGLEASYLAGAQAKRAGELEASLAYYKQLEVKNFTNTDPIAATALVEVSLGLKRSHILLMPKGGGLHLAFESHSILVVTPNSPLGEALVGLRVGDVASVEAGQKVREYQILSVC